MEIGYNEATARDCSDLWQDLTLCEKAGFDFFEPREDMIDRFEARGGRLEDVRAFFRSSRMRPFAMNALYTYQEMFGPHDDAARREEVLAHFRKGCERMRFFGGNDYVVVVPLGTEGYMGPYRGDRETVFEDLVRICTRLAEIGADYGVRVALEPVGARKSSVRTVEEAYAIAEATGRADVGLTVDASNLYVNEKLCDFSAVGRLDPARIFVVHLNDYDDLALDDFTAEARCFCGDGVLPVTDFLRAVIKSGFTGGAAIETFRPAYWARDPKWVIETAYKTTKRAIDIAEQETETL